MKDVNLTTKLQQKMKSRPRIRGRYNASELYGITVGFRGQKTTPTEWMTPQNRSVAEMLKMWNGTGIHNQLEELMGKEHAEKKVEYVYKGITLVLKLDFLPPHLPDVIWEFKSSDKLMAKSKPWHEYQLRLYLTAFDKRLGVILQPVSNESGLYLKNIGEVTRDDEWFMEQMEKLYQFHLEVEKLWPAK